jgi:hypothetical protein
MKKILVSLTFCLAYTCIIQLDAQNLAPEITQIQTELELQNNQLHIHYEVFDAENDLITVWLKVSTDGQFYEIPYAQLSGDIGDDIQVGQQKLTWNFEPGVDLRQYAFKLVVWDDFTPDIQIWVDSVSTINLENNLKMMEGIRHYTSGRTHLENTKDTIDQRFRTAGLETRRQDFVFLSQNGQNIIGRKTGLKEEGKTWIIDGHFDSVSNSPGVDDNATAVAALLEVLRIFKDKHFEESINFIGFDFEEAGLIGSQRYIQSGIRSYENIQGVYNMEMIGYYSDQPNSQSLPAGFNILFPEAAAAVAADEFRGNFLTNVGNARSLPMIQSIEQSAANYVPELRVISLQVPGNGEIAPDLRRSDHAPFWDSNLQALMLTDGANFRNSNYHTPRDTFETINMIFFGNVVKAVLGALAESAKPLNAREYDLGLLVSTKDLHVHQAPKLQIFPNPVGEDVNIRILGPADNLYHLRIFSLDGKAHHEQTIKGNSMVNISVKHLPKGIYLVNIHDGENSVSRELIVER